METLKPESLRGFHACPLITPENAQALRRALKGMLRDPTCGGMQMLYNSDHFAVVQFDVPGREPGSALGGYEIVDKFARREVFLQGPLAQRFERGVQALVRQAPTQESFDEFIAGFADAAQQPLVLH